MRVLVVDDHAETRELLARNLERASHGVVTVGSSDDAEVALVDGTFDVIVLDVMLPDGSGIDLCARLRAGETVLIWGAGGGVAQMCIGIAKHLGARVIATSSTTDKLALARTLGADAVIDHATADVVAEVKALTERRGCQVVVDNVGQATWRPAEVALRPDLPDVAEAPANAGCSSGAGLVLIAAAAWLRRRRRA